MANSSVFIDSRFFLLLVDVCFAAAESSSVLHSVLHSVSAWSASLLLLSFPPWPTLSEVMLTLLSSDVRREPALRGEGASLSLSDCEWFLISATTADVDLQDIDSSEDTALPSSDGR